MDLYLPFCSEYLFHRRLTQLQDSTSLVQCAVDLSTTSLICFEKSPGRDTGLCIWNLHGQLHSCSSVFFRPLSITLCSSVPGMSLRRGMQEFFEFLRKYHPKTHNEQTRWGSRHHNTPTSPAALCSQMMTSPEPSFWLLLCADLACWVSPRER